MPARACRLPISEALCAPSPHPFCATHAACRLGGYFIFQFKATIMGLQSYTNDSYKKIKDRDTQSGEMHDVGECLERGSGERPLRFTPGLPDRDTPGSLPPRSPEVSGRRGAPITGPGLGVGRQEGGREPAREAGTGAKSPPHQKTTHSYNQQGRPAWGPFNSNISLKKKILIWSFFFSASSQARVKTKEMGARFPPTPGTCRGSLAVPPS